MFGHFYSALPLAQGASQVTRTEHDAMFNRPKTKNKINSLREHENKIRGNKAQTMPDTPSHKSMALYNSRQCL